MGRIRTLKPEFWKHESLSELAPETHLLAAALLNYADDEGYFNANPRLVKSDCCPLRDDSTTVRRMLDDLSRIGYIELFTGSDGREYGRVQKFSEHQRVDRPKPSKISGLYSFDDESTMNRRSVDDESSLEGKGREGKGREGNGKEIPPDGGRSAPPPYEAIVAAYHAELPMCPQVRELTDKRRTQIRQRWRENPERQSVDWWVRYFAYVRKCPFLIGQVEAKERKPFLADLEWLTKSGNLVKVIEGRYQA